MASDPLLDAWKDSWIGDEIESEPRYYYDADLVRESKPVIPAAPKKRKEKGMNYSAAVTLITDDVKMIGVKFKTTSGWSKEYVYKSAYEVEEGALVLIHNQGAEDDVGERPSGFGVAKVTNLDPEVNYDDPNKKYKWIAQVVDLSTYHSNLEREAEMLEKVRGADKRSKREQLRDSLLASIDVDERKAITF